MQHLKNQLNARRGDDGGFTLIELLVVIVIIGILSAVVVFSVAGIQDRGNEAACDADRSTLTVAEEANYAENGSYVEEDALVTNGFLESESELWDITLAGGDYALESELDGDGDAKCVLS